jgi:hypothetical protein
MAKNPRGAYLCVGWCELGVQAGSLPCVLVHGARQRGRHDARQRFPHGKGKAHGSELGHGNGDDARQRVGARQRYDARQRAGARQRPRCTAANARTATCLDARQRMPARQRAWTHGSDMHARQSSLPSHFGETHGKVFVAEPGFAVPVLPCVDARQCLCRAI